MRDSATIQAQTSKSEALLSRVKMQEVELRAVRLRSILRICTIVLIVYWAMSIGWWAGIGILINSAALLGLAMVWYLLEIMPHSRVASVSFIALALGVVAGSSLIDGQLYAGALFMLPIPTVAAAFLLGPRASVVVALTCVPVIFLNWWMGRVYPMAKLYPDELPDRLILRISLLVMIGGIALAASRAASSSLIKIRARRRDIALAKTQAEDAHRTKQAFLANMSHEIRTPLHGILGLTAQLERPGHAAQDAASIATMRGCAQELLGLLNDVLDLSKFDAGKIQLCEASFELRGRLEELTARCQGKALAQEKSWVTQLPDTPLWLLGDERRLCQAIGYLLDHAMQQDGVHGVALRCSLVKQDQAAVSLSIEVQAEGASLDAQQQSKLRARLSGGEYELHHDEVLGLGLVLCGRWLRLMGGQVEIASEPGMGTTFAGTTFRVQLDLPRGVEQLDAQEVELRGRRVLVVDDSQINQRIAKLHLSKLGVNTDLASSGEEAVERCTQESYDLVMLDLRMPGLDGVQTAKALRELPGYAEVALIASTAEMDEDWARRCREVGMQEYLLKPFHPDALSASLKKCLQGRTLKSSPEKAAS